MAIVPVPSRVFTLGRFTTPDVAVELSTTSLTLTIDVSAVATAPANEHLEIGAEFSYNGGATWQAGGSMGLDGGQQPSAGRAGGTTPIARLTAIAQQSTNPNRRVRGFVDISDKTQAGGIVPLTLGPGTLTVA